MRSRANVKEKVAIVKMVVREIKIADTTIQTTHNEAACGARSKRLQLFAVTVLIVVDCGGNTEILSGTTEEETVPTPSINVNKCINTQIV